MSESENDSSENKELLQRASLELEALRVIDDVTIPHPSHSPIRYMADRFPMACLEILKSLPGNNSCVDCGKAHPDWASVTYGTLICLQCSGRHRSMGVQVSFARSISMDSWSHAQILAMLEGGNSQLKRFFQRHSLEICDNTYRTKAASFYRKELSLHVHRVTQNGKYCGRMASRRLSTSPKRKVKSNEASLAKVECETISTGTSSMNSSIDDNHKFEV